MRLLRVPFKKTKRHLARTVTACLCALLTFSPDATETSAEQIVQYWNEYGGGKAYGVSRQLPTAIGIYTSSETPNITHESGYLDGVQYDILRCYASDDTIIQVDYKGGSYYLNELVDWNLVSQGYRYAGGINGGYFSGSKPVGAVRRYNAWCWYGWDALVPAYGTGFATCYFSGAYMWLRYHGWSGNDWVGDDSWTWWGGYTIDAANAISGSYTYYADGYANDITGGAWANGIDYRTYGRAVTIFAQAYDSQYMLINIYGTVNDGSITSWLGTLGTANAIRLDGGGSTQMCYETELVTELSGSYVGEIGGYTIGKVTVLDEHANLYVSDSEDSGIAGEVTQYKTYDVLQVSTSGWVPWYRVGSNQWISGYNDLEFSEGFRSSSDGAMIGTVTVNIGGLNIRKTWSSTADKVESAERYKTYDVYERINNGRFTWYKVGENQWIPGAYSWVTYSGS